MPSRQLLSGVPFPAPGQWLDACLGPQRTEVGQRPIPVNHGNPELHPPPPAPLPAVPGQDTEARAGEGPGTEETAPPASPSTFVSRHLPSPRGKPASHRPAPPLQLRKALETHWRCQRSCRSRSRSRGGRVPGRGGRQPTRTAARPAGPEGAGGLPGGVRRAAARAAAGTWRGRSPGRRGRARMPGAQPRCICMLV